MRRFILLVAFIALAHATTVRNFPDDEMTRIRRLLFANATRGLTTPHLCFLVGGIGSGKSTALRPLLPQMGLIDAVDRVHLGYTTILTNLDNWDANDRCTSSGLRDHANELQQMFFEEAIRSRTNVLFEGPIEDSDLAHDMVEFALSRKYVVNVVGSMLPTHTATTRALSQMRVTGHWASLHEVVESHQDIARAFPALIQPDKVNSTLLFDTTVPGHPLLVLNNSDILVPQKFADFMAQASISEDEIRDSLTDSERDSFHSLCDCGTIMDVDESMCGSKHEHDEDNNKSRKRWRAATIAFVILSALLLLGLIVLSIRYSQLRHQGYEHHDSSRYGSYEHPVPRRSPPIVGSGYAKMQDNAV